jgi:hypothetical protein
LAEAERLYAETKKAARVFKDFRYQTQKSWACERRVVAKAEHLEKGANPRFIVTNVPAEAFAAQPLYEQEYCARGEMENRIKEQQLDLFADRTSTGKLWSNQVRLYCSTVAYVLVATLRRLGLAGTEMARATCGTIRTKLLKIGAHVRITVRRVRVALAGGCPYENLFRLVHDRLRAGMAWRC